MINIQKDIIDKCRVILQLIDLIYESSDDITVYVKRVEKIKNLSNSIGNLMVKFEELGKVLNDTEELDKVFTIIRLFENDIPKIMGILDNKDYDLPEQLEALKLENVKKNLRLLETRLEGNIDDIRVSLKILDNVVLKEKVPELSGLMGKLHGEIAIDDVQKAEMNENAREVMTQITESCNNVITDLNNIITLTIGAVNYISRYFELLTKDEEFKELSSLFDVIKIKQNKMKGVLIADT